MTQIRYIFIFFSIFSAIFCKTKDDIIKHMEEFEKTILKVKDDYRAPGFALAIVKDGEIIYKKSFGQRENGKKDLITNDTVFQIASLSKTFLTFVIAQLVEEGLLSWDTPVCKYLPEFALNNEEVTKSATLLDLITHRIGLPSFSGDTIWHLGFSDLELLKNLKNLKLKYKIGEHYGYQNHMFGAASIIVERVTKKTIEQIFNERIFTPLKMKNASVGLKHLQPKFFGLSKPNVALPHDVRDGKIYTKTFNKKTFLFEGSTGVNLSLDDAAKWIQFLVNDYTFEGKSFLKPETISFLRTSKVPCHFKDDDLQFPKERISEAFYDVGMFENKYGSVKLYSHMSGFSGVRGYLCFIPSEKLGVIMLSNYGGMRCSLMPEVIKGFFLDWYLDLPKIDWLEKIAGTEKKIRQIYTNNRINGRMYAPAATRNLTEYEGVYEHPFYGDVTIKQEEGQLKLIYRDIIASVHHWNADQFFIKPYELSETYGDYDFCPLFFVLNPKEKTKIYIGQMYEGREYLEKK
jgi:CubicO group peptidase (beta-lactamase class C family)